MSDVVTMKDLLEAGVHFGHQTRRWNPKMKKYIFAERNGIYIIDLKKSLYYIDEAYKYIRNLVEDGGTILFVGTKKQAKDIVREEAKKCGMNYVVERWLGGMLTNFQTIKHSVNRLKHLEELEHETNFEGYTKKEALQMRREKEKLDKVLGGIRDMNKLPDALFVVDTKKESIAVAEAKKLRIPVIGVVDTNCDPDLIDVIIPANDDAIRSVRLLTKVAAQGVVDGMAAELEGKDINPEAAEEVKPEETNTEENENEETQGKESPESGEESQEEKI